MTGRILKQAFARQRGRKALAALAILCGMAVVSTMLTIRMNIGDDLNRELRSYGANILVQPVDDSLPLAIDGVDLRPAREGASLSEADLGAIKNTFWGNNIVAFAPQLFAPAIVRGGSGQLGVEVEGTYFNHAIRIPNTNRVIRTGMERLASSWKINGEWPQEPSAPDKTAAGASVQVLVGVAVAEQLHLAPGSAIELRQSNTAIAARVSGIVTTGGAEDREVIAPLGAVQRLASAPGAVRQILVSAVTKPEDAFARQDPAKLSPQQAERWLCSPYATSIAREIQDAIPGSVAHPLRPVEKSEGAVLSKMNLLTLFITLTALLASSLALASVMSAAVVERRPEIAVMKSLGAEDHSIALLFLIEAALLGIGSGTAGFFLGEWLAGVVSRSVLGYAAQWKPALAPLIILLSAAVVMLGSMGAVRRAMRTDPALLLRSAS